MTRKQFRQVMAMVDLPIDEEMMRTLEAKYVNDVGFNYKWFLSELEPQEKDKLRYIEVRVLTTIPY